MILPQAILFDWDETLAHTREAVSEAIEHTLQKYNKEPWEVTKQKYRDTSKSFKENFPNFFGKDAETAYQDYLSYYQAHCFLKVRPNEGASDFLKLCLKKRIKLYITSNKEKSFLTYNLKKSSATEMPPKTNPVPHRYSPPCKTPPSPSPRKISGSSVTANKTPTALIMPASSRFFSATAIL